MPELRNMLEIGFKFYILYRLVVKQYTNFLHNSVKTYKNFT